MSCDYECAGGRLIRGDCLEILPTIETASIGMIGVDPPYGTTAARFDLVLDQERLWPELWRVATPACAVVQTAMQPFAAKIIVGNLKEYRHEWIWRKNRGTNFLNTKREPLREHEHVLVFARNSHWTYHPQGQERIAKNMIGKRGRGADKAGPNYGKVKGPCNIRPELRVPSTVQEFKVVPRGIHPQQKPIDLFRYLIRTYSNPGDVVLDYAAGSCTTAIAAIREGRRFIAIESSQEFFDKGVARIESELSLDREAARLGIA